MFFCFSSQDDPSHQNSFPVDHQCPETPDYRQGLIFREDFMVQVMGKKTAQIFIHAAIIIGARYQIVQIGELCCLPESLRSFMGNMDQVIRHHLKIHYRFR